MINLEVLKILNYMLNFKKNRTFIVLGMHRSGTSLIAGGLNKSGINMGEKLLGANEWNPKGHFENEEFIELNDRILAEAGGSWDNPPSEEAILKAGEKLKDEIKVVVDRNKGRLWGWKDPRTTLTIKCYLPYIEHPFFITCWRKPLDVAKSLNKRNGMPIEQGVKIAKEYNKRLIEFIYETVI